MTIGTVVSKKRAAEILLVEDNVADVLLTKKAFGATTIPCHVTAAESGEHALEMLRSEGSLPDLILLDLHLPRKSGIEVLQEIKEDKKLWNIPVIILTTSRADKDISDCRQMHANGYVVKPLDFGKFQGFAESLAQFWFAYAISPYE
ncbi:MAG: response regulator [Alphaproteobacteria bacterium]